MNRILLQNIGEKTKEYFTTKAKKYSTWAVNKEYKKTWENSVGDTVLFIKGGYIFAIAKVEEIMYDDNTPKYPLRYYWNNNIQFVNIPLDDFNEAVGYAKNYFPRKYHTIKEIVQGFDFLSKYMTDKYFDKSEEDKPVAKKALINMSGRYQYPRNPLLAKIALEQANFKCELDENHDTFKSRFSDKNFTEAHHLIPLSFHKDFDYDLDVPSNIVSLCPNCHRMIHNGTQNDIKNALEILHKKRKKRLQKSNLDIKLDKLLNLYKVH